MAVNHPLTFRGLDVDATVRAILEGTATETGERFFAALVENLANALNTCSAWVTEYIAESRELRSLAFWANGRLMENFQIDIAETPCENVLKTARPVHYPDNIAELFPNSSTIEDFSAVSYMGFPLVDSHGKVLGNLAVLDNQPMPKEPRSQVLFRIFAARAAACEEIGGDYFDFLVGQDCANNHFDAVGGDVTGHGVEAALLMIAGKTRPGIHQNRGKFRAYH